MSKNFRLIVSMLLLGVLCLFCLSACNFYTPPEDDPAGEPGDEAGDENGGESGDGSGDESGDQSGDGSGDENGDQSGDGSGDESGDGVGDETDEASKLYLSRDGAVQFSIVYNGDLCSNEIRTEISALQKSFRDAGMYVDLINCAWNSATNDCELLIGETTREQTPDIHTLGNKGYTIKVIDNKIVVLGGTNETTLTALRMFVEDYLLLDSDGTDIKNLSVDRATDHTVVEQYNISAVNVGDTDLSEYKIVCDTEDALLLASAQRLRKALYDNAGYYLPIVDEAEDGERVIVFSFDERDYDTDGFSIRVSGGNMYISCQYPVLLEGCIEDFIADNLYYERVGEVSFDESYRTASELHYLRYSDFGAVGDGVTDDFAAIKATHAEANLTGQTVLATEGKIYNLGAHADTIIIQTDVIWTGAHFIIDDSAVEPSTSVANNHVFTVKRSTGSVDFTGSIESLAKGDTNVGRTFDGPYMLVIKNSDIKQYIRYGENADAGADQQEIILVNANGDIDPLTPLLWNYDKLTSVKGYPISDVPITITGGIFTTIANQAPRQYTYYKRGISVERSNVTFYGITHYISGEGDSGAPYNGFLSVSYANNVLFDSIVYTGHKTYKLLGNNNNSMGSYDIAANSSNNIKWLNCTQTNSITDSTYWGVMGTNYCKNLTYDGCILSRFDAHKGMYNATIINSTLGHSGINAIGAGLLLVENCTINRNYVINLRNDYGSTWEGDVIIRNVHLNNTSSTPYVFNGGWYNHDFGYTCYLPKNVTVDNLTVAKGSTVYVFSSFGNNDLDNTSTNNPMVMTETVTVTNNKSGYTYKKSQNTSDCFDGTTLTVN